jgi:hypothetical protein
MNPKNEIMAGVVCVTFTAAQIRILAPALSLIVGSYQKHLEFGFSELSYPFRTLPPPPEFNCGTLDQTLMEEICDLGKILKLRSPKRRKVKVNTIQLRAAAFALRAHISFGRFFIRQHRTDPEIKANRHIHKRSLDQLKAKSQRLICALEREIKRANRASVKALGREKYEELTMKWKMHLRWMRLHIAYFKPWGRPAVGLRKLQQNDISVLMEMAKRGLRDARYHLPSDKDLRRVMRLYTRYARQGRQGKMTVHFIVDNKTWFQNRYHLAHFVIDHLNLKELSNS